jgi:type VI secretion system protein ImpM
VSQSELIPGQPGLYGKLVNHGDFVTRRLPREFTEPWDNWLQDGIAESRKCIGRAWEAAFEQSPVWRFLLPPGVCDGSAWAGIVQPSVDRVGRHFPLTIAVRLPSDTNLLESMLACTPWFQQVESIAEMAFDQSVDLNGMDHALTAAMFPEHRRVVQKSSSEDTVPIRKRKTSAFTAKLAKDAGPMAVVAALQQAGVSLDTLDCMWMTAGTEAIEPAVLVTDGLPARSYFGALYTGAWSEYGWDNPTTQAMAN